MGEKMITLGPRITYVQGERWVGMGQKMITLGPRITYVEGRWRVGMGQKMITLGPRITYVQGPDMAPCGRRGDPRVRRSSWLGLLAWVVLRVEAPRSPDGAHYARLDEWRHSRSCGCARGRREHRCGGRWAAGDSCASVSKGGGVSTLLLLAGREASLTAREVETESGRSVRDRARGP